jgi:NAD(P)-dependent dehydrogenase (short-subunit alcohol dehydrogenase family)
MNGTSAMMLQNRTALVTGASKGVGKGIALALGRAGCNIAVNYFSDAQGAGDTVSELKNIGVDAFPVSGNVGNASDVKEMFAALDQRFQSIDILVNNAGIQTWGSLLDLEEAEWDRVMDTNLKGCFLCTQAAARRMRSRSSGVIVNIGSGSNKVPFPNLASYTTSKGGIEMFTKAAAVELGPYGIRVNCVAPGAIAIERTELEAPGYSDAWAQITPLRRIGTPQDVGDLVVFLATEQAAFITGQTIWVDGAAFTQPRWPHEKYQD